MTLHWFLGSNMESIASSLASIFITLIHILPVDDIEESLHVISAEVLVLKVVGVLPDIKAEQGNQSCNTIQMVA